MYFSSPGTTKRCAIENRKLLNTRCIENEPSKVQDAFREVSSELLGKFHLSFSIIFNIILTEKKQVLFDQKIAFPKDNFVKYLDDLTEEIQWYEKKLKGKKMSLKNKEAETIYYLLINYQETGRAFLETIEKNLE